MIRKGINYIIAYLLWAVTLLLALWLCVLARNDFLGLLAAFYLRDSIIYVQRARFFDRAFTVGCGLLWFVLMIVWEEAFRTRAQKPELLRYFARIAGVLLLLISAADLVLVWLQGVASVNWSRWLMLAFEPVIGIVFLWYVKRFTH
ncbi:MAG: hypothetical protein ACP5UQ_12160 [Anaerolineae bacterium]